MSTHPRFLRLRAAAAALSSLLLAPDLLAQGVATQYQIINIPSPSSSTTAFTSVTDINNRGQAVGVTTMTNGQRRAFVYQGGVLRDLGTVGGVRSNANAINDRGEIVGASDLSNNKEVAFLYQGGRMQSIGTLAGGTTSLAQGISENGAIVGQSDIAGKEGKRGFIYKNGSMTEVPTLGGLFNQAASVNAKGEICGSSTTSPGSGLPTAYYLSGKGTATVESLGTLGGDSSTALFMAANGDILGTSRREAGGSGHAFRTQSGGTMQDLFPTGTVSSVAYAQNKHGVIVGKVAITSGNERAFIAAPGGSFVDLNTLIPAGTGFTVSNAVAINDAGVIACNGVSSTSPTFRAFLLIPGPGPAVAITEAATGVNFTTATLHGAAIANGSLTEAWFEWGTSSRYGSRSPVQSVSGTERVEFSATIAKFRPHTRYYFRVAARNAKGIAYGGEETFVTLNSTPVSSDDLLFLKGTEAGTVNVIANDVDADKDRLSAALPVDGPARGTVKGRGVNVTYTPGENFTGTDIAEYRAFDGFTLGAAARLHIMNKSFDGLLQTEDSPAGIVTVTLTGKGSFTAAVRVGTAAYRFKGALDGNRHFSGSLTPRNLPAGTLMLDLDPVTATITGTMNNGTSYDFTLANALAVAGEPGGKKYTALLNPGAGAGVPSGFGFGLMEVAESGVVSIAGRTADGAVYTAAARLRADGTWNFFAPLGYRGTAGGFIGGSIAFAALPESDCAGAVRWIKPATSGPFQPEAIDVLLDFEAAVYTPPATNAPVLDFGPDPSVALEQGGLAAAIPHDISISARHAVTIDDPGADRLALKIKAATGLVTGSFVHPLRARPTSGVFGAVYQKENTGARGLFIGATAGGSFSLTP